MPIYTCFFIQIFVCVYVFVCVHVVMCVCWTIGSSWSKMWHGRNCYLLSTKRGQSDFQKLCVCVCFRRLAQNGNVNGETWDINHRVLWYPISRQTHFNSWSNCCFTIKVDPVQLRSFCHENNWLVDSTHSSVLTWKCEVFLI